MTMTMTTFSMTSRPDSGLVSRLSCRAASLAGLEHGSTDALAHYRPGDSLGQWIDRIGSHDPALACGLKRAAGIGVK